jgi:hypothetical protein
MAKPMVRKKWWGRKEEAKNNDFRKEWRLIVFSNPANSHFHHKLFIVRKIQDTGDTTQAMMLYLIHGQQTMLTT